MLSSIRSSINLAILDGEIMGGSGKLANIYIYMHSKIHKSTLQIVKLLIEYK